jgi:hypothetical protein
MRPVDVFEVTSGILRLNTDGTLSQELVIGCKPIVGTGGECDVPAQAMVSQSGTYSSAEGRVEIAGRSYAASFEPARVTITIAVPPSQGLFPRFELEYRK